MPLKDPEKRRKYQREYSRRYYQKHKERLKRAATENRSKRRKEYSDWKAALSCVMCGFSHPAAMDFHHVVRRPDNRSVSMLAANGAYDDAKNEAVSRCIVLCANCHRIHHWNEHRGNAEIADVDDPNE